MKQYLTRIKALCACIALLFVVLSATLFWHQIVGGEEYVAQAETAKIRTIATKGSRGRILDRYGRTLAGNKAAYDVVLNLSGVKSSELNQSICGALAAMRSHEAERQYHLPIESTEQGLVFSCVNSTSDIFARQNIDKTGTAAQALDVLRASYAIPEDMPDTDAAKVVALYIASENHYAAYTKLDKATFAAIVDKAKTLGQPFEADAKTGTLWPVSGVRSLSPAAVLSIAQECEAIVGSAPAPNSLPIRVGESIQWNTEEIRSLKAAAKVEAGATAEQCLQALIEKYKAEDVPADYLLDFLAIRLAATQISYRAYTPLVIGVSGESSIAATINEHARSLPGISVEQSMVRDYPYGELLSATLGYTGRIVAGKEEEYQQQGYDVASDLVGRDGLELQLEPSLRAQTGSKTVTIDRLGQSVTLLEEQPSKNGQDVVLTIDLGLQQTAETALDETMADIRDGSLGEAFPNAYVGAAVALDVKNGEVLALASRPGYDLNLFSSGVTDEIWQQLNPEYYIDGDTSRPDNDPTLPRPMVNNAVSGAYPPGSTYKPVTALAGLQEGVVDEKEQIEDLGRYTRFSETQAPACWTWNDSHSTHGQVNMHKALAGSCNYYFYEVGYRVGNKRLEEYARKLGLGEKTGIELPNEAEGTIGGETSVQQTLKKRAGDMVAGFVGTEAREQAQAAIDSLVDEFSMKRCVALLQPLGLDGKQIDTVYNYINDNRWRESRIVSSAVGQGDNNFSTLQMANMTAALSQGGLRFKPHMVKSIPATNENTQAEVVQESFIDKNTQRSIRLGMYSVVNEPGGTAYKYFANCDIRVAGKTGSAQFEGRDAYAWFIAYAPAEDPQIAVAVMIGQGGHGAYAAPVARRIIEQYFAGSVGQSVVPAGEILP